MSKSEMEMLEWDARSYDALPLPHKQWGARAIERLRLTGSEIVFDLGCGTGRDTELLLDALPNGRVIAVDGSEQMLTELRAKLAGRLERVTVLCADLRETLALDCQVDAVLSVATLHWLPDHAQVFRSVANALRRGGRLVAEAGGAGNVAKFRQALREISGSDGAELWNFAGVEETRQQLEQAGFSEIEVDLVADPAQLEPGEQFESFLATVLLGAQLRELPPEQRRPFVQKIAQRLPESVIDYVRLQISAVRR
ncbi:MAG: class I SAM-dependent methyltransferase [Candidatus Dormibacteraceae bacterium]